MLAEVPSWRLTGDSFGVRRCRVPCGCTFAQAPDNGQCDGSLAWHVREGSYGDAYVPRAARRLSVEPMATSRGTSVKSCSDATAYIAFSSVVSIT